MIANDAGRMVDSVWKFMPREFPCVELDEYVVMPNHFHALFRIVGAPLVGTRDSAIQQRAGTRRGDPAPTVGDIVGAFKSITTDEYIRGVHTYGWVPFKRHVWQRGFYDHIVRNDEELSIIRDYIQTNPLRWEKDPENS
jgi:REP element-mobilizing transposase RayT